jgi:hypothetical protein
MRLYGGRMIRNKLRQQVEAQREVRDAIVFSVDTTNRSCMVKIQGSDRQIEAHFQENWRAIPEYLKLGNAVRICQGGSKGRIEVVGHGFVIPIAVPGGTVTPPAPIPGDAILSGIRIKAADPANMQVMVATGTYRIGGIIYTLGPIEMDRIDIEMDRYDIEIDGTADVLTFGAASSYFRYDIIVIGADGDAHIVSGTQVSSDPVIPTAPAGHVIAGWVLIYPGMTVITQADINCSYTSPTFVEMRVSVADQDLAITELSTLISIAMLDQYGQAYSGLYSLTITFLRGNGTLSYGGSSSGSSLSFTFIGTAAAIIYTRDGNDPGDQSPTFLLDETAKKHSSAIHINVYGTAGNLLL